MFVIFLSLAGLALACKPPATILQIATQTFTGLAVLFPTVFFGLYFKKVFPLSAILSIICGEIALLTFYFKWIPSGIFLPVVWVMIITFFVYLLTHIVLLQKEKAFEFSLPDCLYRPYFYLLIGIFSLATDFWAWGESQPVFMGVPLWMGYFIVLSAAQTMVMLAWVRKD